MALEFAGQVAVVTGGASGIGVAIARGFAAAGAHVAAVDVNETPLETLRAAAASADQQIGGWRCDVTRSDEVRATCAEIAATLGPVSILVNNVGGSGPFRVAEVEDITDEAWDFVLSLNLGSIMRFCRSLVPEMKTRRYGRIVNVSSSLKDGIFGPVGTLGARLPYVTAKSAIVGLTKQLAKDLGPVGITVNAIAPGFTLPGEEARITQRFRALPPEEQRRLTAGIPAGRPASGEDMAHAVAFLASPRSSHVSGEVLTVAGGG